MRYSLITQLRTTNYTPFELLYGHQAILPTALSLPLKPTYTYDNYAEELKQRLRATQQVAKSHINEAKIKAKIYADQDANQNLQNRRQSVIIR